MSRDTPKGVTRFAPSITGFAHPGTLFSALIVYLEGNKRGLDTLLRLDDLDRQRFKQTYQDSMLEALEWMGLEFDTVFKQSERIDAYDHALKKLAEKNLTYACRCSRKDIQSRSHLSPDGGWAYDNHCRELDAPALKDLASIRIKIPNASVTLSNSTNKQTSMIPLTEFGDPIAIKRDQSPSYHFSSLIDDIDFKVTHVFRGEDLFHSSFIHICLFNLFNNPIPALSFHPLILDEQKRKLSKSSKSLDIRELKKNHSPQALLGIFAKLLGIQESTTPTSLKAMAEQYDSKKLPLFNVAWP